jgi:uncharacterized protein (TIGR02186 family)
MRILAFLLCMIPLLATSEEIVLGMSQDEVAITATFDGSNILVFGAIKRESAIPEGELGVIVTIAGPSEPIAVHRKERRFGIWVNSDTVEVDAAPSFYAIATSAPLDRILKDTEDLRHQISIERAIRSVGAPMTVTDAPAFTDAVIRIRKSQDLYKRSENSVLVEQETLFRTSVDMPANLTEGDYFTRIFLTRDGQVVSEFETTIDVKKVGLERFLYTLSRQQPLVYGLLSLAIAILAGWLASSLFRMIRGT